MFDPGEFWLFPTVGKIPVKGWMWQDRRMSRQEFNEWRAGDGIHAACSLAVALGERSGGLFCVDYDVDKSVGEMTEETIARLMSNGASACRALTPSGGIHDFYRGTVTQSGHQGAELIDIKGEGGYVVIYPDPMQKNPYTHYQEWLIPPASSELLEWIAQRRGAGTSNEGNTGRNISFSDWIFSMVRQGLDYADMLYAVRGRWHSMSAEDRAGFPLAEAEAILERKIKAGIVSEGIEQVLHRAEVASVVYGESIAEFIARKYQPLPAVCGPIQGGSTTIISGAHKAGKSLFALYVAGYVAAGQNLCSWGVPGGQSALYIDGENQSRTQYERITARSFPKSDNFRIAHRDFLREKFGQFTLANPDCQQWVVNAGAGLVVLDSLTALNPPDANTSLNDVQFIESIMPMIDQLTSQGTAVLILHNLNKSEKSHGTNALAWRSDRLWHLYRREGFKTGKEPPLTNHPDATAGMVLRALDGDRSLQVQAVDSEWQFFMDSGWKME